jgi:subtilisin
VTTGAKRVGTLLSPTAHVDGVDERVNADIAILDTGVDRTHPDLNVVGGVSCVRGFFSSSPFKDGFGHGTLVAGVAAAKDNTVGIVGVAPGARVWSVKVFDDRGNTTLASILCGFDWVAQQASVVEVANLSFGGPGLDTGNCGRSPNPIDLVHQGICSMIDAGVVTVAAAGNSNLDASGFTPAAYSEVLTVSALADSNGLPGGGGPGLTCMNPAEIDDTFAFFSNFGAPVDVAAPGVCVRTTLPGNRYGAASGTSFSAPYVSGAAALLRAVDPGLTPAQVAARIKADATDAPMAQDPDGAKEGVLNVAGY